MLFERARSVQNGLKRVPPVFIAELEIVLPPRKVIIEVSQIVIVYRSGLTKGTGVLSGARRIDVTMSITRIPL